MNSTHAGNHAGNAGDSIFSLGLSGTLFVTNSIFSGNSTGGVGGGIGNTGTATVTNSTLIGNSAFQGGGIISNSGTLTMTNTIVAGNTASNSDPDLSGAFTSGGHNLIGDTTGSTGITNGGTATSSTIPRGSARVAATVGRPRRFRCSPAPPPSGMAIPLSALPPVRARSTVWTSAASSVR